MLLDAFVLRMLFGPATMHVIGPANWRLPRWLDGLLPHLSIEGDQAAGPEPDTTGDNGDGPALRALVLSAGQRHG